MPETFDQLFTAVSTDVAARTTAPEAHVVIAAGRRRSVRLAAASVTAVLVLLLGVLSLTMLDGNGSKVEPAQAPDVGEAPVWYDDVGLHHGDAVVQPVVPLRSGRGVSLSLVRTGALYLDKARDEVWFHPWGGEPQVIGSQSPNGAIGDPAGDIAAWFENSELVVYDTVLRSEITRLTTTAPSSLQGAEHLDNGASGNGILQVSPEVVVWEASGGDAVLSLDIGTSEVSETTRGDLVDVHDETQLRSWGTLGSSESGLSVWSSGQEQIRLPAFEATVGRFGADGRFLLGTTKEPHGTGFVDLETGESFLLPDKDVAFYGWVAWSYGSTALIRVEHDDGNNAALLACDAVRRECSQLPSTGAVTLPSG